MVVLYSFRKIEWTFKLMASLTHTSVYKYDLYSLASCLSWLKESQLNRIQNNKKPQTSLHFANDNLFKLMNKPTFQNTRTPQETAVEASRLTVALRKMFIVLPRHRHRALPHPTLPHPLNFVP